MIRGYATVLFTLFLIENVCANACGHDNCETAIDIPLITKLNTPMKVELDVSSLTTQLKELIGREVEKAVLKATNNLVENIIDKRFQTAVDRLQTSISITACARDTITYNDNEIITFSDVKLAIGISNVNNFRSSGIFTCEKQGLYLIGAYIMSNSSYAQFQIIKNGFLVSRVQVNPFLRERSTPVIIVNPDPYHTGTGIIAVQLDVFDTLKIKAGFKTLVYGDGYSCLTVIKVK
ncbi:unnamed protein product [Mytilus coruscus]|uniref:C1q domain-containing protein n=1 Tax=Mytilus coruscus TaxID=42192 RepID=A0A6J8EQT5_MYTCO|nr:unnamed protein product [Mytilus coruscus]